MRRRHTIDNLILIVYFILLTSIVFTLRAFTSISFGLLSIIVLCQPKEAVRTIKNPMFVLFTLYFLWQWVGFFYADNNKEALRNMLLHSGLVMIPFAVIGTRQQLLENFIIFKKVFITLIVMGLVSCITYACALFFKNNSTDQFFYHQLAAPLGQHAVFLSILSYMALLFALEISEQSSKQQKSYLYLVITAILIFIILLSSKLVILFTLFSLPFLLLRQKMTELTKKAIIPGVIIILLAISLLLKPVTERFSDILSGSALTSAEAYNPGVYLNGIEFRVLQWRIVPEILSKENGWIYGLGASDSQDFLDDKYSQLNMYQGNPSEANDTGYLGLNTHNQFLESLLQSGLAGLCVFGIAWLMLIIKSFKSLNIYHTFPIILICIYCFAESLFQTQYGIVLFCMFPLINLVVSMEIQKEKLTSTNPAVQSAVYS